MSDNSVALHAVPDKAAKVLKKGGKRAVDRYRIAFYSLRQEPLALPGFAYEVAGCVLGHTKFIAYVMAGDQTEAEYAIRDAFEVAQVECIDFGWHGLQYETLRGTLTEVRPRGWLPRLLGWN